MDKKSAISCAVLDIEPTRHSTVKKKLWKKLKKIVYDGKATSSGGFMRVSCTLNRGSCHHFRWCSSSLMRSKMKPCMHGYQLLMSLRIKWDESLWNSKYEIMHHGVSFIQVSFVFWWCGTFGNNKMKSSIGISLISMNADFAEKMTVCMHACKL